MRTSSSDYDRSRWRVAGLQLAPVAGTLLQVSEWARQAGNRSLLVIDEINAETCPGYSVS